jgi:hypothetical protein
MKELHTVSDVEEKAEKDNGKLGEGKVAVQWCRRRAVLPEMIDEFNGEHGHDGNEEHEEIRYGTSLFHSEDLRDRGDESIIGGIRDDRGTGVTMNQ